MELAEQWKKLAERRKSSVSQFVVEHVLDSISKEKDDSAQVSREDLAKRLRDTEDALKGGQAGARPVQAVS